MLTETYQEKVISEIKVINKLTYTSDRTELAGLLKEKILNDIRNEIDDLFENLNLKGNEQ